MEGGGGGPRTRKPGSDTLYFLWLATFRVGFCRGYRFLCQGSSWSQRLLLSATWHVGGRGPWSVGEEARGQTNARWPIYSVPSLNALLRKKEETKGLSCVCPRVLPYRAYFVQGAVAVDMGLVGFDRSVFLIRPCRLRGGMNQVPCYSRAFFLVFPSSAGRPCVSLTVRLLHRHSSFSWFGADRVGATVCALLGTFLRAFRIRPCATGLALVLFTPNA